MNQVFPEIADRAAVGDEIGELFGQPHDHYAQPVD